MIGAATLGLYTAATKIPNIISMLSTIFLNAWNMSAIMENDSEDRNRFYSKVYEAYEAILFVGSAALILFIKPVSAILINYSQYPEYRNSYLYTPLLIAAAVFTCMNLFLAGIYTATKNTKNAFFTISIVAVINIILNIELIPAWGVQGAAFATFLSYLLCYCIRMIDARYYIPFNFSIIKTVLNTTLLLLMSVPIIFEFRGCFFWEFLLAATIIFLNYNALVTTAKKLLSRQ